MGLFNPPPVEDVLDRLLDQERQLILSGQIEALSRVATEKDSLLSRLPHAGLSSERVNRLRQKADRNQQLLAAMAQGLRRVTRRLEAMRGQASGRARFSTYDQGGRSAQLTPGKSRVERRA